MKKIVLFLFLMFAAYSVNGQGNVASILSKIEKSNGDLQNPSKAKKANTWLKNADFYIDLAETNIAQFISGTPASVVVSSIGAPINAKAPEIIEINGIEYVLYKYSEVDAYFTKENVLAFFVETKAVMPDALAKAEKSANEAFLVDSRSQKNVMELLVRITDIYTSFADNNYNIGKYGESAPNFYNAGRLSAQLNLATADDLLYFAVVSYVAANKVTEAKPALDLLVSRNYFRDGYINYYQGLVEAALGNNAAAEAAYISGIQMFPENSQVLNSLIAFYITNNEDPNKVIPFIKKAQETNPTNAVLYIAEGLAYESMKDTHKSIIAYNKAVELAPDNFDALYNLGLAYYHMSENISKELLNIDYTQAELYNKKQKEIDDVQMKSLGVLLRAHAIDANEKNTIELVRSIYFRQRNKSAEMMKQYEVFNEKSKK